MTPEQVVAWRDAAVADGWAEIPTYPGSMDTIKTAATLSRDGFVALLINRPAGDPHLRHADSHISLWGPDGLSIPTPDVYNMQVLLAGLRVCTYCSKTDVPTERVGFAGRCCAECLPEKRKQLERPGWCD